METAINTIEAANIALADESKPKAPWIGVGKSGSWNDIDEAMHACGLDFDVTKEDLKFSYDQDGISYFETVPNRFATVRSDVHKPLGVVSNTYQVVQNSEIFSMLDPFVKGGGSVTAGGMTIQGLCFMVVDMGIRPIGGDNYTVNVMATNSFNGEFPAALIISPVRIICQNMYRSLMGNSDNVSRFRHCLNASDRLGLLKSAYDMFNHNVDEFSDNVEHLKLVTAAHSIDEFVEFMFPYSNLDETSSRYEANREKVDERRTEYINKYYRSDTNSDFGTCFALVNAYYDYVSHHVPIRKTEDSYRDQRLSSLIGGTMVQPKLMNFMCEEA